MRRFARRLEQQKRRKTGSQIAEFGPALWVLLIFIFFPMVDLLSMGVSYGLCMVLNYNQVREASLLPNAEANSPSGTVKKGIPDKWIAGMGQFTNRTAYPATTISYRDGETDNNKTVDKIVGVSTTVTCHPFLPIPIPVASIPGINGPMTFTVFSECPMENPDYAQP